MSQGEGKKKGEVTRKRGRGMRKRKK